MDEQQGRQKVFITGGAGFIGTNLVKYLLDRNGFKLPGILRASLAPDFQDNVDG